MKRLSSGNYLCRAGSFKKRSSCLNTHTTFTIHLFPPLVFQQESRVTPDWDQICAAHWATICPSPCDWRYSSTTALPSDKELPERLQMITKMTDVPKERIQCSFQMPYLPQQMVFLNYIDTVTYLEQQSAAQKQWIGVLRVFCAIAQFFAWDLKSHELVFIWGAWDFQLELFSSFLTTEKSVKCDSEA